MKKNGRCGGGGYPHGGGLNNPADGRVASTWVSCDHGGRLLEGQLGKALRLQPACILTGRLGSRSPTKVQTELGDLFCELKWESECG